MRLLLCWMAAWGWTIWAGAAEWSVLPPFDQRQTKPPRNSSAAKPIQPGDAWPNDQKFRWLMGELVIPEIIGKEPSAGRAVGLQINCGDGGEVWVADRLQARFDNDHPALALLAESATNGQMVRVAVQVYGKVQGGDKFSQANWVLINRERVHDPLALTVRPDSRTGPVPAGLIGLSQGGGMADYEEATARKLAEGGFRQEGLPLDFVSWHEYFQPPETIVKEADTFRAYLAEFPELQKSARHLMITEWNEAWWADRPQDHEVGAAWCANTIIRAFLPAKIDRPCFFYAKQGDQSFRGDYSLLLQNNTPKASFNVARIFNGLRGEWLETKGADSDVSLVATWDAAQSRLAVVLVNFRNRYALRRPIRLRVGPLPSALAGGTWHEWLVDATHGNVWHDPRTAELMKSQSGLVGGNEFIFEGTLQANSVTLLELLAK